MKRSLGVAGAVLAVLASTLGWIPPAAASASSGSQGANFEPSASFRSSGSAFGSTNWSGYALANTPAKVVAATISVPQVDGSGPDSHMSDWVGLGGYTDSGTLIQAGIEEQVIDNVVSYSAWTEIAPDAPKEVSNFTVAAGDRVQIVVGYDSSSKKATFILSSSNSAAPEQGIVEANSHPDPGPTVEWIHERTAKFYPGVQGHSDGAVAKYSGLAFNNARYVSASNPDSYTNAGSAAKPIIGNGCDNNPWSTPSSMDSAGSSFSVNWNASGIREMDPCSVPMVVAKGADSHLIWTIGGGAWTDAGGPTGGVIDSAPSIVDMDNAPGTTSDIRDAFARGVDGKLYRYRIKGQGAGAWTNVSYGFSGDPSVTRIPNTLGLGDAVAVTAKSDDNSELWFVIYNDDASGLNRMAGQTWVSVAPPANVGFASSPSVVYTGTIFDSSGIASDERLALTALGTDGAIYTATATVKTVSSEGFKDWEQVPYSKTSYGSPSMVFTGDRYILDKYTRASNTHLFALGSNGVLWEDVCTGTVTASCWGGWNKVGPAGQPAGKPLVGAGAAATPVQTYIAATGSDGSAWVLPSDANSNSFGSGWIKVGEGGKTDPSFAAAVASY